ncbi:MAG: hypothetical protein IKR34_02070 [Candidatus Gastranaerophilales bacterium]|nr:hypothetical protein [Elusimicrobiota bacterium]MBR6298010.1 hypothetical protein [Candidatus Gastranaerophilales bacterium]
MINEIKTILKNIQQQRQTKEKVTIQGNYTYKEVEAVYNDAAQKYETKEPLKSCENVSTVKSFVDFIKEELKRRNRETGSLATAVIDSNGGHFTADDDFQRGNCKFTRSLSEQWIAFRDCIGRSYNHEEFLRLMQKLSPSIVDFENLYPTFLDIRVIGRAETVSKPFYVKGETESGIRIKFKMQGGEDENITMPEKFSIALPYAKGNYEKLYNVDVQLVYDNKCGINILIQAPMFEQVEETALLDEVEYLKKELSKYPDLLVLFNF